MVFVVLYQGGVDKVKFTRKQWVLAGLVGFAIINHLIWFMINPGSFSLLNALSWLQTFTFVAILLKFVLPNWNPHRLWLAVLTGTLAATFLARMVVVSVLFGFYWLDLLFLLDLTVMGWFFWLFIGAVFRKRTQKIAATVMLLNAAWFAVQIGMQLNRFNLSRQWHNWNPIANPAPVFSDYVHWSAFLSLFAIIAIIIVLFASPILKYPILSKENTFMQISLKKATELKQKPDPNTLGFGNFFTDHMFIMDYKDDKGWYNPRIVPYAPFKLDPAAMCLHYGQEVFEGMKAYYGADKKVRLFRPQENLARLNASNDRMCIPQLDEAFALHAIEELVRLEHNWIPTADGTSLYIRPYIIAVDPFLGVRPASQYVFAVILSPVGAYYPEGLAPVKIFVEQDYVRAVRGGTGFAKAGGNYAATLKAQQSAKEKGCTQVLWLDGIERKYIEEVGTSNAFFVINNEVITPALSGSILPGVTRKSCIELLRAHGYTVVERAITLDEVLEAAKSGTLKEAFATGTAAVISPMGALVCGSDEIVINGNETGAIAQWLYNELTGIQWGRVKDNFGWTRDIA